MSEVEALPRPFRTLEQLREDFLRRRETTQREAEQREVAPREAEQRKAERKSQRPPAATAAAAAPSVAQSERSGPLVQSGLVRKVFPAEGFCFIASPESGGRDVFLHFSDLEEGSAGALAVGVRVRYEVQMDPRRAGGARARRAAIEGCRTEGPQRAARRRRADESAEPVPVHEYCSASEGSFYSRAELLAVMAAMQRAVPEPPAAGSLTAQLPRGTVTVQEEPPVELAELCAVDAPPGLSRPPWAPPLVGKAKVPLPEACPSTDASPGPASEDDASSSFGSAADSEVL